MVFLYYCFSSFKCIGVFFKGEGGGVEIFFLKIDDLFLIGYVIL